MSILSKLPLYYRSNPTFLRIAEYISASSCLYSTLFFTQNDSLHLLLKDGSIHLQLDWEAFSLLRANSRLILCSGQVLRKEPGLFKSREDYQNHNIRDLYDALLSHDRQKLFFFTRKMSPVQLRAEVNEKLYEVIELPKYSSVHDAVSQLMANNNNLPMNVELGLDLLHQYMDGVRKSRINHIDTLLISKFTGNLDQKFIGPKLTVPLHEFYQKLWTSEAFPCEMSNGQKGSLTMEVHKAKQL